MHGTRKFCQRRSNSDKFCLVVEGREDPNTTLSLSSSSHFKGAGCPDPRLDPRMISRETENSFKHTVHIFDY